MRGEQSAGNDALAEAQPTHHRHDDDAYSVVFGAAHTCIAPTSAESVFVLTSEERARLIAAARAEGRREVREAVEGVLREGPDTWTPYDSRDTGETFLAESVTDFTADLRAALAAETPTESAEEAEK